MANLSGEYWKALKSILTYIRGVSNIALCCGGLEFTIRVYVDLYFVGVHDKRKSITGYVFTLAGVIRWVYKLQIVMTLSTIEAEYMVATQACKQVI